MGKTLGKDKNAGKLTYTSLYGLDESKCKLACLLDKCCDIISKFNVKSDVFEEIISGIKKRVGI